MKKIIIILCLIITVLTLSACGSSTTQNQTNGNPPGDNGEQPASENNGSVKDGTKYLDVSDSSTLSLPMQLIIGTLKLQDTENEVDAETAEELIPLWKAVKSLSNSDTTSQLEMDALYRQIQRTMTQDRIDAIVDMKLTKDNMMQMSQELGLSMGGRGGRGSMSEEQRATMEASQADGGGPAGGGMMMGGGGPGGGMPGGGMMGGAPAQDSSDETTETRSTPLDSQVDSSLIDAVIEYLQSITH